MADEDSYLSLIPSRKETTKNLGSVKTYGKFVPEDVTHLAIHHTGGTNPQSALNWWKNSASGGVGAQFIIDRDGSVIEAAPMTDITGHIMPSLSNKKISNKSALGIELVASNDKEVTSEQKEAVRKLYQERILPAYPNIKLENIVGHGELAKGYTGSHARHPEEGMSVVNYLKENLGKPTEVVEQETPNYLSLMQRPTVNEEQQTEREYKPGFYNPNIVAQGERARAAGGGNLEPAVNEIANVIKSMNIEDWKKESLLANMLKYGVGGMPIVGDEAFKQEGQKKLLQTGEAALSAISHPIQTFQDISKLEPGQLIGEMIKGGVYDAALGPATKTLMSGASSVVKPVVGAVGERLKPIGEQIVADYKSPTHTLRSGLHEAFEKLKNPQVTIEAMSPQMAGVGAANVTKQSAINNLIPNLTPETQNIVKNTSPDKINLPALETKALEEKLGINLSKGQRTNDKSIYANEWNARNTNPDIQRRFSDQPQQFADSFEKTLDKHASDIGELTKENIGQLQINGLVEKDLLRQNAIKIAYKELENANGGQLPIDISQLNNNINNALTKKLKTNVYEDKLATIKKDIDGLIKNGQMTFDDFENLRSNLADEMRTNQSGSARAAAHIIREQLENLPFPENMQHLKPLADKARSLYKERMETIKNNPAYKAAVKEADTMEEAESGLTALNAAKFHDKYVTNATPEAARRMIEELQDSPNAIKAIKAGDIINARDALVPNTGTPQLKPDMYNKYLRSQSGKAKYVHDSESLQDLLDYGILSSKVAKPTENVFNYSNSYSAYLGDLLKEGLQMSGEGLLAASTKGVSIPVVSAGKGFYSKYKSNKFAQETTNPYSGIIQEK